MKKQIITAFMAVSCLASYAKLPVTKVVNPTPAEMVGIDMATDVAKKSVAAGNGPWGAVIVLNGQVKGSGSSADGSSAEANAMKAAGLQSLKGTTVFTVNQPADDVYQMLSESGVDGIYFVNGSDAVVGAGLLPASAYDESALEGKSGLAPLKSIPFPEAQRLLKK